MKNFVRAMLAVLSGFIGIRKKHTAHQDQKLSAKHIIAAGVLLLALFITTLLLIVRAVL